MGETEHRQISSGRYLLIRTIASGGMGRIWESYDTLLNRTVAIKEVSLDQIRPIQRQEFLARAEDEGRNAAALADHPNIVTVYDVVVEDGVPWTVMQLVRGRSLADLLKAGPMSADAAALIAKQMLSALQYAHEAGIVHRDVKPPNIMVTDHDSRALLTDFGIAKNSNAISLTQTGTVLGSAPYMAPERVNGESGGPPSDLFSLGVTLFEAVEGFSPFGRDTPTDTFTAILVNPLPAMRHAHALEPLISAITDKDPLRRPSAAQALAMLEHTPGPHRSTLVGRIAGGDRYDTSVAVSHNHWAHHAAPTTDRLRAKAVVLATGEGFADAVAGVPLAAYVGGPLLLTEPSRLTPVTEQEIVRILPTQTGRTVYLLGGTSTLTQHVADRLTTLGYHVSRLGGTDRYATARAIAHQLGEPSRVVVATGRDYADALAAGPLAARFGAAILLSDGPALDPDTAAYVRRSLAETTPGDPHVVTVGGDGRHAVQAIAGDTPWLALSGTDRYSTAAEVAFQFATGAGAVHTVGVATGEDFVDALSGGALMATLGSPLLLTQAKAASPSMAGLLQSRQWHELREILLFGGTGVLSQQVEDQITRLVGSARR